jgi:hypothetical protein
MKKLRLYKKDLAKVSEDDMAFIEAYKAIKTAPAEPVQSDYYIKERKLVASHSYITKESLLELCDKLKPDQRIYIDGTLKIESIVTLPTYAMDKARYDKDHKQYIDDMEALHPIVVEILEKAKSK